MAVTADFILDDEEDSADESLGEEGCCPDPPSHDGHALVNEALEPSVALSEEALVLLSRASRSLGKRRRASRSSITPLFKQLKSLRNLVPYSTAAKESCVVSDAIVYLKRLKQEIEELQEGLVTADSLSKISQDAFPSTVNISSVGQTFLVHVSCQKRPGLMSELMVVLEESGLVFDDVNASCNTFLIFDASSSQKGIEAVDKEALRHALLKTIYGQ